MKLTTKSKGLDSVGRIMRSLAALGNISGAQLDADNRQGPKEDHSIHNGDVINFLAGDDENGRPSGSHRGPKRDIRPDKADTDKGAKLYLDRVENRIRVLASKSTWAQYSAGKRVSLKNKRDREIMENVAESGLRAAMGHYQKVMSSNVESNKYEKVSTPYAQQRERDYQIPHGIVLRASGQLLKNLQGARFRLYRGGKLKSGRIGF